MGVLCMADGTVDMHMHTVWTDRARERKKRAVHVRVHVGTTIRTCTIQRPCDDVAGSIIDRLIRTYG
jgi:hypothetical protein